MICFGLTILNDKNNKYIFLVASNVGAYYSCKALIDESSNLHLQAQQKFTDLDSAKYWLDTMKGNINR